MDKKNKQYILKVIFYYSIGEKNHPINFIIINLNLR